MILKDGTGIEYLYDFHDGKIKQGLTIDCKLDDYLRFKAGQFVMINGLDNVGKTNWILWYFLCLSIKYNVKWCIWSGENKVGQLKRDLIQMYTNEDLRNLNKGQIDKYIKKIDKWFNFIDINLLYNHRQLLNIFSKAEVHGCLIDPFTGLNHDRRVNQFERNYEFCNDVREFCNKTQKSIYVNTHPQTEAARRVFASDHLLAGYMQPPKKSDTEGGQAFANRSDDFVTIHRIINHPTLWTETEVHIRKIKDMETGGRPTFLDEPLRFNYNRGLGFTVNNVNPIRVIIETIKENSKKTLF